MVPPSEFIPLAEESSLIEEIGCWVMTEACRQNKAWQEMGLPKISMAVNLAHRQFFKSNLISEIQRTLDETGLDAEYLDIELTEGILAENAAQANFKLAELKALGVQLSIDDFGTGYSSLAYLKNFPIDTVKIDRCFVQDIETDIKDAEICMAIIAMTHSINLKVVAEGVETQAQLDFLRSKGCDIIQGYFYSKPLSAQAAENFLRQAQSGR
jgi:EAL domain-containing protein (putative c-di-GMP-specific phosphodiesterase class I)